MKLFALRGWRLCRWNTWRFG